ncbi:MAG: Alcohol dehydrogenase GroES domain protein [Verrucomicrobiales bacterium]|nr:Alcohol dehydrogenase GroES domain protein [Verrucomicrobiales bacterium]
MKAIQLERPGQFRMIEIAEPNSLGRGEALVRVHCVGVCGTDYSGYLGKMPFFSYPRIPGHELGVEVISAGADVTNVKPGDRCSVEPYINCQICSSCRRGLTNCCENHQTLGVHCDGGLRSLFTVPARKLHISKRLNFEQLALVETLAIGCHAVNRANAKAGEIALIIGAGPIGLSAVEFVKVSGATCIVMDINAQRLDFCKSTMGVDHIVQVKGDGSEVETIQQLTNGELPHVVIDATGSNKSMSGAYNYAGFGGRLVFVGISPLEISFAQPLMHRREMSFLASRNALSPDFSRIIQLIEDGKIDTRPWITHRSAFNDMIGEFPKWLKPEAGVIKAMVAIE